MLYVFNIFGQPVAFGHGANFVPMHATTKNHELVTKYVTLDKFRELVVDIPYDQSFIVFGDGTVSEMFEKIGEPNEKGERKVTKRNHLSKYLNRYGDQVSIEFNTESEPDAHGNTILTYKNNLDETHYVIADREHKVTCKPFYHISKDNGTYIAQNGFGEQFFIRPNGQKLSKGFDSCTVLKNGVKIIKLTDRDNYTVLGNNYRPIIENLVHAYTDKETGITTADLNKDHVVFGLEATPIAVDKNVARLLMNIVQDKRMGATFIDKVIDSETDIIPTMEAFNKVIGQNLKLDPENEKLNELYDTLENRFSTLLKRASQSRIRKSERKLQELNRQIEESEVARKKVMTRKINAGKINNVVKTNIKPESNSSDDQSENV